MMDLSRLFAERTFLTSGGTETYLVFQQQFELPEFCAFVIHDDDDAMGWELFGRAAYRHGKWKITWTERPFGPGAFELFDIVADPGESRDLRSAYPAVYERMVQGFEAYAQRNGVVISRPLHWD